MKVVNATLSTGREIQIREILTKDLSYFLKATPAFRRLAAMSTKKDGKVTAANLAELDEDESRFLNALLARLSGLTLEEVEKLPMVDGLLLMTALGKLIPQNFSVPEVEATQT